MRTAQSIVDAWSNSFGTPSAKHINPTLTFKLNILTGGEVQHLLKLYQSEWVTYNATFEGLFRLYPKALIATMPKKITHSNGNEYTKHYSALLLEQGNVDALSFCVPWRKLTISMSVMNGKPTKQLRNPKVLVAWIRTYCSSSAESSNTGWKMTCRSKLMWEKQDWQLVQSDP